MFDESHEIKSESAKRTQALVKLAKKSRCVLMLSGTPQMNGVGDLYYQFLPIFGEEILGTIEEFMFRYGNCKRDPAQPANWVREGPPRFLKEALLSTRMVRLSQKNCAIFKGNVETVTKVTHRRIPNPG